ncbi:ankyrin repeat domain-containing protein SOWAHD [Genypterus blacodes]|uniref:ankyrin repeat domain-containing protein SOWAHD n=1 Tax=Genypterus blacodes TaxID=154954 RepID=UPI003F771009
MSASGDRTSDDAGYDPAVSSPATHGRASGQGAVVERRSSYGVQVLPFAVPRRSRFQRQQQVSDQTGSDVSQQREASQRGSLTPAMRRTYLKELLLNNSRNSGFGGLSAFTLSTYSQGSGTDWALYPMEHAWMLSAVEGNYETILDFISVDPHLLTRRDFISGYSVLHWLAKRGQDEILVKVLRYAESEGLCVNINLRGSGGLTPLHVATMHGQYMVIKLLVGAFGANVDAMDYNGKRPWQYLKGNAPPEMKELLGTWDDEHNTGWEQNVNNNSAGAVNCVSDEGEEGERKEEDSFVRTKRSGSWRFGSFRKLIPSFPFFGHKS